MSISISISIGSINASPSNTNYFGHFLVFKTSCHYSELIIIIVVGVVVHLLLVVEAAAAAV